MFFNIGAGNLSRRQNTRLRRTSGQVGNDKHLRAGKPLGLWQLRAAPIGHDETSSPAALQRDPIGKGMQQQRAGKRRSRSGKAAIAAGSLSKAPGQPPRRLGPLALLRLEAPQTIFQIDALAAKPLFRQQHSKQRRLPRLAEFASGNHHGRQSRR